MRNSENGKILKTKSPSKEKGAGSEKLEMRREAREKLPPFPEPKPGEDISTGSPMEEDLPTEEIQPVDLEEICGNIWVCLYQLGGLIRKDFKPLSSTEKKLLAPPSARLAVKYHIETYMNDEIMLAGLLGVSITGRLITSKPKEEKK